jgi:hypothetical protein
MHGYAGERIEVPVEGHGGEEYFHEFSQAMSGV